jgi:hypothetical protein
MLETVLGLWVVDGRLSPWRIGTVLHCCKSAKLFYQVSRAQLTSSTGVGVECGMVAAAGGLGRTKPKYRSKKQIKHFNGPSEKRERRQREKVGLKSPSLQKMYSAPARQSRLAPNRLTGQDKASPAKSRRLLMCWQLLACIPSALVEGDNIRPQDACWANAHWARAHRCGLVACRRTWPPESRLLLQGAPVHMFAARHRRMVPDQQRSSHMPCTSRSETTSFTVATSVAMREAVELTQDPIPCAEQMREEAGHLPI